MELNTIVGLLANLSADLAPSPQTTAEDLERARVAIASAVVSGQSVDFQVRPPTLAPRTADEMTARALDGIARRVQQAQPPRQRVMRREFATATSPLTTPGPTSVAGRAVIASHGPFLDRVGRAVWIDVFDVLRLVGIMRAGSTQPFLHVVLPIDAPSADTVRLGAGSVWFAASALTTAAPSTGFIGLRIKGGTVALGTTVPLSATAVVIPAAVTVRLRIELDPPAPAAGSGSGSGADARGSHVRLPVHATFAFGAAGTAVTHTDHASVTIFGTKVALKPVPTQPSYDGLLGRVAIPFQHDVENLRVAHCRSTLASVAGEAPILESAWSLPVTLGAPDTLGTAAGAGGVALRLADGLKIQWAGLRSAARGGPVSIVVEPGIVTIAASTARVANVPQRIRLWQATQPAIALGELELRFPTPIPFRFISEAAGVESVVLQTSLAANLDPPRTVNAARFPFATKTAQVVIEQTSLGSTLKVEATVPQTGATLQALALKNLVLKTSDPLALFIVGQFVDNACLSGTLALEFAVGYALPILPDPYAANVNFDPLARRDDTTLGFLVFVAKWQPNQPPNIDINLPTNVLARTQRLVPRQKAPVGTEEDRRALDALRSRFEAVVGPSPNAISLLDLSTNSSLFGVSFAPGEPGGDRTTATPPFAVADLFLESSGRGVHVLTVPAVQWETVFTPPDPKFPSFPGALGFVDSGGATEIAANSVELVPIAPRPAIDALLEQYNRAVDSRPVVIRFTLPFGIVAVAEIAGHRPGPFPSPSFDEVTPPFPIAGLKGVDQLSIRAHQSILFTGGSPILRGMAVQLHNAFSGGAIPETVLSPLDDTFNANFGPSARDPFVPVTRFDLSGFGASTFSDWNTSDDRAAIISKAQFEVIVGRTSFEVVMARSLLYPYGARVVRSITIERQNNGTVTRRDGDWQAITNGEYSYPNPDIVTHPGVVRGVVKITNIRDTGQRHTTPDGSELMAVRFDCYIQMENAVVGAGPDGVPALDQLGYVQLTDPLSNDQLARDQYGELLGAVGSLGGPVDCVIDIGGSGQRMRVSRVGVAATIGMGGPEFVMAAWGSPVLPGGGQWSFLRQAVPGDVPQAVDRDRGVPLVRAGAAPAAPPATAPYCFADPEDALRPNSPGADYGIVHATGTQRLFFPRPKIEPTGPPAITSSRVPLLADPYTLGTSVGLFPRADACIPFPDANYSLRLQSGGNFLLQRPSPSFSVPSGLKRVLLDGQAVRSIAYYADENHVPSQVTVTIDTAAAVPWSVTITNLSLATESGSLGEVTRVVATVDAVAGAPTRFKDARLVFGPPLKPVQAVVSFLENFGPIPPLAVNLTNEASIKAGLKIDFQKILEDNPVVGEFLKKFIVDLAFVVTEKLEATNSQAAAEFDLTVKIPTPFPPIVAIGLAKFTIKIDSDFGTALVFQIGVGVGVEFPIGPFKALAYFAESQFLITGDTVFGLGAGALIKGSVDLEVVSIDVSVEAKIALLKVSCHGGADSAIWAVAQVTFALEVTIFLVIDIDFEVQSEIDHNIDGGNCTVPDVL